MAASAACIRRIAFRRKALRLPWTNTATRCSRVETSSAGMEKPTVTLGLAPGCIVMGSLQLSCNLLQ